MKYIEDFHYISQNEKELIKAGYGKLSIHSIHFDRYVTDEEKKANHEIVGKIGYGKEWDLHCANVWSAWSDAVYLIIDAISEKYSVYQYKNNNIRYGDHDLFFWSNKGWNSQNYMTGCSLTFNDKKSIEYNMDMLNDLKLLLTDYPDGITCRVQYDAVIDHERLNKYVTSHIEPYINTIIDYGFSKGKIKWVECNKEYGFFRKGAKKYYSRISDIDLYFIINKAA